MANKIITIDTGKWMTQAQKANDYNGKRVSIQYINKLIKQGKLTSYVIQEIGIVLVER